MSRYVSKYFNEIDPTLLERPSDESVSCMMCTKTTMLSQLVESIDKGMGVCKLCKKHQVEMALMSYPNIKKEELFPMYFPNIKKEEEVMSLPNIKKEEETMSFPNIKKEEETMSFPNIKKEEEQPHRRKSLAAEGEKLTKGSLAVEEEKLTQEENEFLRKYFYRFGVKKREIKRYCKGMPLKSFIIDVKAEFFKLNIFKGNHRSFTETFFKAQIYPPFQRIDMFMISLKDAVEKRKTFYHP